MSNTWAILLAGGVGSRLWPASTASHPKQVQSFGGDESLIRAACRRLESRFAVDRILVMTGHSMADAVRGELPHLPDSAFLVEPEGRNTLPCLLWATAEVMRRGGTALVSVHADHEIPSPSAFLQTLDRAVHTASRGHIALIGLQPQWPNPELGWICPGPPIDGVDDAFAVTRFVEKPDAETAETLIREGALWNLGLFAWRVDVFAREAHRVGVGAQLTHLAGGAPITEVWPSLPRISIDHGLLQSSECLAVVPGQFEWSDLGTWKALQGRTNAPRSWVSVDCTNVVVDAPHAQVITIGVQDIVVAVREGRVLISALERSSDVGSAVKELAKLNEPDSNPMG